MDEDDKENLNVRALAAEWTGKAIFFVVLLAAILFGSSGRVDWVSAWVFLLSYGVMMLIASALFIAKSPGLIDERLHVRERDNIEPWDRRLTQFAAVIGPFAIWIVAGLDERNGWSADLSPALQLIGLAMVIIGQSITNWAMLENRFFSALVRIQEERGHSVIDSGPYAVVRHPGYVGAILFDVGSALLLDSAWALVPAIFTLIVLVIRTAREDAVLHEKLAGYAEYAQRTRYRLLPGIW
jgi:protein-S-isoprenylcysteine O-methyltransferase Ste14